MSIERFLLVNLMMDLCLLTVIARSCGVFRPRRIAAAALVCLLYGLIAAARPLPWRSPALQCGMLALVSMCIVGAPDMRLCGLVALLLAAGAMLSGGSAYLLARPRLWQRLLAAMLGLTLAAVLLNFRHPLHATWRMNIGCALEGKVARFPALIDTGNRLREPISNLPVLIAEARLLESLLPAAQCRTIAYGAVGGSGSLQCFLPSAIWAERGRRRKPLPIVWIAVMPGRLPGPARALAPCEFASLSL